MFIVEWIIIESSDATSKRRQPKYPISWWEEHATLNYFQATTNPRAYPGFECEEKK